MSRRFFPSCIVALQLDLELASYVEVLHRGRLLSTPLYSLPDRVSRPDYFNAVPDPIALDVIDVSPFYSTKCDSLRRILTTHYYNVDSNVLPLFVTLPRTCLIEIYHDSSRSLKCLLSLKRQVRIGVI